MALPLLLPELLYNEHQRIRESLEQEGTIDVIKPPHKTNAVLKLWQCFIFFYCTHKREGDWGRTVSPDFVAILLSHLVVLMYT